MAEMKRMDMAITVDDGSRRVPILNVDGEEIGAFTFRPTDIGIVERFNRLADSFDRITEPLEAIPEDGGEEADAARREALAEAEKRLYAGVNELFGGDAAGAFFGRMHPFSPVNGAFYCEQVLGVVGRFISDQFDAETAKFKKRVAKYVRGGEK